MADSSQNFSEQQRKNPKNAGAIARNAASRGAFGGVSPAQRSRLAYSKGASAVQRANLKALRDAKGKPKKDPKPDPCSPGFHRENGSCVRDHVTTGGDHTYSAPAGPSVAVLARRRKAERAAVLKRKNKRIHAKQFDGTKKQNIAERKLIRQMDKSARGGKIRVKNKSGQMYAEVKKKDGTWTSGTKKVDTVLADFKTSDARQDVIKTRLGNKKNNNKKIHNKQFNGSKKENVQERRLARQMDDSTQTNKVRIKGKLKTGGYVEVKNGKGKWTSNAKAVDAKLAAFKGSDAHKVAKNRDKLAKPNNSPRQQHSLSRRFSKVYGPEQSKKAIATALARFEAKHPNKVRKVSHGDGKSHIEIKVNGDWTTKGVGKALINYAPKADGKDRKQTRKALKNADGGLTKHVQRRFENVYGVANGKSALDKAAAKMKATKPDSIRERKVAGSGAHYFEVRKNGKWTSRKNDVTDALARYAPKKEGHKEVKKTRNQLRNMTGHRANSVINRFEAVFGKENGATLFNSSVEAMKRSTPGLIRTSGNPTDKHYRVEVKVDGKWVANTNDITRVLAKHVPAGTVVDRPKAGLPGKLPETGPKLPGKLPVDGGKFFTGGSSSKERALLASFVKANPGDAKAHFTEGNDNLVDKLELKINGQWTSNPKEIAAALNEYDKKDQLYAQAVDRFDKEGMQKIGVKIVGSPASVDVNKKPVTVATSLLSKDTQDKIAAAAKRVAATSSKEDDAKLKAQLDALISSKYKDGDRQKDYVSNSKITGGGNVTVKDVSKVLITGNTATKSTKNSANRTDGLGNKV